MCLQEINNFLAGRWRRNVNSRDVRKVFCFRKNMLAQVRTWDQHEVIVHTVGGSIRTSGRCENIIVQIGLVDVDQACTKPACCTDY